MNLKDAKFLLTELKSNECACGSYKNPGNSFCYACFKSLPNDMQKPLYSQFGRGYEEAYEEATQWLKAWEWEGD
jgi:hypothetical protein